jgi:hypothetical protein
MKLGHLTKISSWRAYKESRGVLERNRWITVKYLYDLCREFSKPERLIINDRSVFGFTRGYLSSIRNDKARNGLNRFVVKNIYDITRLLQTKGQELTDYINKIRDTYKTALNFLDIDCNQKKTSKIIRYDVCPQHYDTIYPVEKGDLIKLIAYPNDVDILLDSYFLQNNEIHDVIIFVTTDDTHILKNRDKIMRTLNQIIVNHPTECIPP